MNVRRSLAVVAGLSLLAACGSSNGGGARTIAASFYPLQFVAERVAGDRYDVTNLTRPGVEPHDLELGVRESARLAEADLVVYERGLQPAVDAAVEENADGATLDAASVVRLRERDGQPDPHFWQDTLLLADVGDAVAKQLGRLDPAHAADYERRAEGLRSDLTALDREYAAGLSSCARSTVVVNHDAFEYLSRYGLRIEPISGLSPDAEPTPGDLARLHDLIRAEGITTVFSETLVSKRTAQTLADELGIGTAVLDPLEGLGDKGADYLSVMRANLAALRKANGC
jgi:zinc transport system substrate-binding protein